MNRIRYASLFLALVGILVWYGAVYAQEPLKELRLLGQAPDDSFWIGTTPGQVVTLGDGSTRQMRVLWRLSADGSAQDRLAEGYDLVVDARGNSVRFTRHDSSRSGQQWGVDLRTGQLSSRPGGSISPAQKRSALIPGGRAFQAPDGQKKVILVNRFFEAEMWLVEGNGSSQLLLSAAGELFSDLAWAPRQRRGGLHPHPAGQRLRSIRRPVAA